MQPIPCGSCYKTVRNYERWLEIKQQGKQMTYLAQVVIEADTLKLAVDKAATVGELLSVNVYTPLKAKVPEPPTGATTEALTKFNERQQKQ
jgi:hypothetical protein